jgi:hypothetical protein
MNGTKYEENGEEKEEVTSLSKFPAPTRKKRAAPRSSSEMPQMNGEEVEFDDADIERPAADGSKRLEQELSSHADVTPESVRASPPLRLQQISLSPHTDFWTSRKSELQEHFQKGDTKKTIAALKKIPHMQSDPEMMALVRLLEQGTSPTGNNSDDDNSSSSSSNGSAGVDDDGDIYATRTQQRQATQAAALDVTEPAQVQDVRRLLTRDDFTSDVQRCFDALESDELKNTLLRAFAENKLQLERKERQLERKERQLDLERRVSNLITQLDKVIDAAKKTEDALLHLSTLSQDDGSLTTRAANEQLASKRNRDAFAEKMLVGAEHLYPIGPGQVVSAIINNCKPFPAHSWGNEESLLQGSKANSSVRLAAVSKVFQDAFGSCTFLEKYLEETEYKSKIKESVETPFQICVKPWQ